MVHILRASPLFGPSYFPSYFHTIPLNSQKVLSLLPREAVGNIQPGCKRPQMGFTPITETGFDQFALPVEEGQTTLDKVMQDVLEVHSGHGT